MTGNFNACNFENESERSSCGIFTITQSWIIWWDTQADQEDSDDVKDDDTPKSVANGTWDSTSGILAFTSSKTNYLNEQDIQSLDQYDITIGMCIHTHPLLCLERRNQPIIKRWLYQQHHLQRLQGHSSIWMLQKKESKESKGHQTGWVSSLLET